MNAQIPPKAFSRVDGPKVLREHKGLGEGEVVLKGHGFGKDGVAWDVGAFELVGEGGFEAGFGEAHHSEGEGMVFPCHVLF